MSSGLHNLPSGGARFNVWHLQSWKTLTENLDRLLVNVDKWSAWIQGNFWDFHHRLCMSKVSFRWLFSRKEYFQVSVLYGENGEKQRKTKQIRGNHEQARKRSCCLKVLVSNHSRIIWNNKNIPPGSFEKENPCSFSKMLWDTSCLPSKLRTWQQLARKSLISCI